jgi:hypothetical protein
VPGRQEEQGRDAFPAQSDDGQQQAQLGQFAGVAAATGERYEESRRLAGLAAAADLVQSAGKQRRNQKEAGSGDDEQLALRQAKIVIRSPAIANSRP